MQSSRALTRLALALVVLFRASPGGTDVCQAPSPTYPTIQSAIDAPVCTEIELPPGAFEESVIIPRDIVVRGASAEATVIEGHVSVNGGSTVVSLADLTVDGGAPGVAGRFTEALLAEGGAEVNGQRIVVRNGAIDQLPIFGDGFESGDTSAWSAVVP